jgi:hypothetical protein
MSTDTVSIVRSTYSCTVQECLCIRSDLFLIHNFFLFEIELQVVFQKFILDHTRIETVPKILGFYPSRDVADLLSEVGIKALKR